MTYVVIGLIVTNLVAVVVAAFMNQAVKNANVKRAELQTKLTAEEAAHRLTTASAADEKKRLEGVVSFVKDELQKAENDLAKASTPAAVRARLNNLFPPAASDTPASGSGVLTVGSTKVGGGHVSGT